MCLPRWRAGAATIARDSTVEIPQGFGGFYAVATGSIRLRSSTDSDESAAVTTLVAGDFGLTLLGHAHLLIEGVGSTPVAFEQLLSGQCGQGLIGPSDTSIVHGFFPLTGIGRNPFTGVIPEMIIITGQSSPLLANMKPIIKWIQEEQTTRFAGWEATVNRLVKILFVQTLRAYVAAQPGVPRQSNWLVAAMDSAIGPVLGRIHAEPEKPWTVNSLAKEANMAKSAFSERFRQVVGEPPLQYLTAYRMQKACELLCESELGVKEIASRVGYESASSFSNAFKRLNGNSPAGYRKNGGHL